MSRRASRAAAVLALAALGILAGCGSSGGKGSSGASQTTRPATSGRPHLSGSVTVFAAASLTQSFTELGHRFTAAHPGTSVKFSFGASSALAQQIIAGAPADVFASASPTNMAQVVKAGDALGPRTFATNIAEIAVAPASAGKVKAITDLGGAGVKLALCQPQVPCGVLATTVLAKAHVGVRPVTLGLDVKSTLAYVTSGEVDAAIVYVTDVRAAAAKVRGVQIPAADNASTAYVLAQVKSSRNAALAVAFEDFVLSATGRSVLLAAGFRAP